LISKKFIQSSFIYTLAGALPLASAIILLPLYGKYLSPEAMGEIAIYFGFSLLVQIIVTCGFDSSLYINYHEFKSEPTKLAAFISTAFVFILFISLVVGLLFSTIGGLIFWLLSTKGEISFYPFGILSVATGIFQALQKVNNSLLQTQQKPTLFFWSNLLSFSLIVVFTIAGIYIFPNTLWGPVGGRLIATLLTAAWVLGFTFRQVGFHFNWALLKTTFAFNGSVYIYQVQQWFINFFDRPFILLFLPLATLGVYDLALKCLMAIEFILTGLNTTFYPNVLGMIAAQKEKGGTVEINRYYHGLTAVAMLLVSTSIFVFPWVIEVFFTKPGYQQAVPLLPFLAIIYLFRCARLFVAVPYSGIKYVKPLPYFYLIMVVVKIGAMYLLIGSFGIYGVIAATWMSCMAEIIILYLGIRNRYAFKINAAKMIVAPLSLGALILVLEPLLGSQFPYLVHGFYVIVSGAMLLWAYRNEIKTLMPFKN
jgi:O-antigen/teichoic acid export membrane protein